MNGSKVLEYPGVVKEFAEHAGETGDYFFGAWKITSDLLDMGRSHDNVIETLQRVNVRLWDSFYPDSWIKRYVRETVRRRSLVPWFHREAVKCKSWDDILDLMVQTTERLRNAGVRL